MAAAADGERDPSLGPEQDSRSHVLGGYASGDGGWPPVDHSIPEPACRVVPACARVQEATRNLFTQTLERISRGPASAEQDHDKGRS
jgi:hypothetical protein